MSQERNVLIALGANLPGRLGPPSATIRRYMGELAPILGIEDLRLFRASSLWRTPAWPAGSGPDYVNAAASVPGVALAPIEILARLHALEAAAGRARGELWAPRTLDLDLLAVGDAVVPDAEAQSAWRQADPEAAGRPDGLVLPHPRMERRAFVLVPLAEVAPRWRHPVTGRSVSEMLAALPAAERDAVERIA